MKRKPSIPDQRGQQIAHMTEIVGDIRKALDELDSVILESYDAYKEFEEQCDDDWPMLAEVVMDGIDFTYWLNEVRDQVLTMMGELKRVKYLPISSRP